MTTLKQEAQIKLLERKLQDMQREIDMLKEGQQSNATHSAMLPEEGYYYLGLENFNAMNSGWSLMRCYDAYTDQNIFPSAEVAEAYADAFRVILELRRCEGSGTTEYNATWCEESAWCLDASTEDLQLASKTEINLFSVFPPFPTEALAEAAIKRVGLERILNAMKWLANYDA